MDNMAQRWEAFGFAPIEVDGHDRAQLSEAFAARSDKPMAIIARTVKGKGVSFAENNVDWHDNVLTDALYRQAMEEVK